MTADPLAPVERLLLGDGRFKDGPLLLEQEREAVRLLLDHARAKAPYRQHITRDYTEFDRAHDDLLAFARGLEEQP